MTIGVLAVQGAFIEHEHMLEKLLLPDILWQQELFFSPIILLQMLLFFFYGCTILKGSTYSPSTLKRKSR